MIQGGNVCVGFLVALACLAPAAAAADDRFDMDETFDMAPDGTIHLVTGDADVVIVGSQRSDVRVEVHYARELTGIGVTRQGFRVEVTSEGGDLRIRDVHPEGVGVGVGYLRTRYDVRIEAPAGVDLAIRGDDDDYDISGMAGEIALEIDDGDVRLTGVTGNAFDLELDDGRLEMDGGSGSLRLTMDDGEADLRRAAFSEIRARGNDADVRVSGPLDTNGRYELAFDDADLSVYAQEAGGDFFIEFADGSLDLQGARGRIEVGFDDGAASFRDTAFESLRVTANDGKFDFDGTVPAGADYHIQLDDGEAWFRVRDGGGRIDVRHDDGRVEADNFLRLGSESGRESVYEWGEGDASVSIRVNDGSVTLSAP